jgi:putative SOS response-associated peptidase YedK
MCGRLVHALSREDYRTYFDLEAPQLAPTYNAAPTHSLPVVRECQGVRELVLLRWGFPGREGSALFNARSETAAQKPSFRAAYRSGRALLPVTGWYEWKDQQPYFIHRSDGRPVVLAALWQAEAFTILTCAAGEDLAWLHHRVPVVLERKHWEGWLRGEPAQTWLKPFPPEPLAAQRAHPRVGNVRNNDPSLLAE